MEQYKFNSQIKILGDFASDYPVDVVKNEPMLFNCDFDHAFKMGGVITRSFLDSVPYDWKQNVVVDSRVHMLMKGWFPCIPGYHHDDVPRSAENGQPEYSSMAYHSEHLMGMINGDICPTSFAIGEHYLPKIENDTVYKRWHQIVDEQISSNVLKEVFAPSGKIIYFDWQTMHSGTKAVADGFRWFIRLSRNTDRVKRITNELRRQTQDYLEFPMEGW